MSVTCARCNDPLTQYADETLQLGRCCVNLPKPWEYDEDQGRYCLSEAGVDEDYGSDDCNCDECRAARGE